MQTPGSASSLARSPALREKAGAEPVVSVAFSVCSVDFDGKSLKNCSALIRSLAHQAHQRSDIFALNWSGSEAEQAPLQSLEKRGDFKAGAAESALPWAPSRARSGRALPGASGIPGEANRRAADGDTIAAINKYRISEFKAFEEFLSEVYFGASDLGERFRELSPKNKTLLEIYFDKVFQNPHSVFSIFEKRQFPIAFSRKRNEEKRKLIFRRVLRLLRDKFRRRAPALRAKLRRRFPGLWRDLISKDAKCFYFWLFRDSIARKTVPVDLAMDLACECVTYVRPKTPSNNWRWKKFGALKKISPGFRLLLRADARLRRAFLRLLSLDPEAPLLRALRRSGLRKLRANFRAWEALFGGAEADFAVFQARFSAGLGGGRSQTPWTLAQIKNSILFCRNELSAEEGDLDSLLSELKQSHYSFS